MPGVTSQVDQSAILNKINYFLGLLESDPQSTEISGLQDSLNQKARASLSLNAHLSLLEASIRDGRRLSAEQVVLLSLLEGFMLEGDRYVLAESRSVASFDSSTSLMRDAARFGRDYDTSGLEVTDPRAEDVSVQEDSRLIETLRNAAKSWLTSHKWGVDSLIAFARGASFASLSDGAIELLSDLASSTFRLAKDNLANFIKGRRTAYIEREIKSFNKALDNYLAEPNDSKDKNRLAYELMDHLRNLSPRHGESMGVFLKKFKDDRSLVGDIIRAIEDRGLKININASASALRYYAIRASEHMRSLSAAKRASTSGIVSESSTVDAVEVSDRSASDPKEPARTRSQRGRQTRQEEAKEQKAPKPAGAKAHDKAAEKLDAERENAKVIRFKRGR
ncbi:MAG: hypothetical protein H7A32_03570 [Deltaproteobacteria bacterium]|nr:hypothetical protein [Deltaproteobacteria bacterium]